MQRDPRLTKNKGLQCWLRIWVVYLRARRGAGRVGGDGRNTILHTVHSTAPTHHTLYCTLLRWSRVHPTHSYYLLPRPRLHLAGVPPEVVPHRPEPVGARVAGARHRGQRPAGQADEDGVAGAELCAVLAVEGAPHLGADAQGHADAQDDCCLVWFECFDCFSRG